MAFKDRSMGHQYDLVVRDIAGVVRRVLRRGCFWLDIEQLMRVYGKRPLCGGRYRLCWRRSV